MAGFDDLIPGTERLKKLRAGAYDTVSKLSDRVVKLGKDWMGQGNATNASPDIDAATARNAGTSPGPRGRGSVSSAFGDFSPEDAKPKVSKLRAATVKGMSESPFGSATKAAGKVAGAVAKSPATRAAGRFALRNIPVVGGVMGLYGMAKDGINPQNVADTAAGFLPPGAGTALMAANYALSDENRGRTAIGQVLDPAIDYAAERTATNNLAEQSLRNPAAAAPKPAAAAAPAAVGIDTAPSVLTGQPGGQVSPEALIGGTAVPQPGQGAFQRTTPGNEGQAVGLRSAPQVPQGPLVSASELDRMRGAAPAPRQQYDKGFIDPNLAGDVAGARTRYAQARHEEALAERNADRTLKMRGQDVTLAGTRAAAGTAARTANAKAIDERINAQAARDVGDPSIFKTKEGHAAEIQKRAADRRAAYAFTVGDEKGGRSLNDLSETEMNRLEVLYDVRERVKAGDTKLLERIRDTFGQKRFKSRNLYDSMPVAREGNRLVFRDGNSVDATEILQNWTNLLSNDPADVQVMEMIRNLPQRKKGG